MTRRIVCEGLVAQEGNTYVTHMPFLKIKNGQKGVLKTGSVVRRVGHRWIAVSPCAGSTVSIPRNETTLLRPLVVQVGPS